VIVLDASAVVELLLGTPVGRAIAGRIADPAVPLHIPHLTDVEVAQALRRYARKGEIGEADGEQAIVDLRELDLERHPHEPLMERVWALRDNVTAYDAVYLALAEALDATLLTCDAALARVPGIGARVEVVSRSG
jgi:predicted nucleic acid-binding protein